MLWHENAPPKIRMDLNTARDTRRVAPSSSYEEGTSFGSPGSTTCVSATFDFAWDLRNVKRRMFAHSPHRIVQLNRLSHHRYKWTSLDSCLSDVSPPRRRIQD